MARRMNEPDEALGPAINGLELLEPLEAEAQNVAADPEEFAGEETAPEPEPEEMMPDPVLLICGMNSHARAVAILAAACGFSVEVAKNSEEEEEDLSFAEKIHIVPDFADIIEICGIGRNYFVGIFGLDEETSGKILSQCLLSDAYYVGLDARGDEKKRIFAILREGGAPDAELAAICCSIGLNIGAETVDQFAVAVVAEMLAAKNGSLNRLRYED